MRLAAFVSLPFTYFALPLSGQIVDTSHSPYADLRPVPVSAVALPDDSFWGKRRKVTLERSMPTMFDELEKHGTLDNFLRLEGKSDAPRRGPVYTDSDIYKWLEAAAYFLGSGDHPQLKQEAGKAIEIIVAAQEPSGYLNTWYVGDREKQRFTEMNRSHELYCLGHLLQAAVAFHRATGDDRLLTAGRKYADYVISRFGPEREPALTGHPELEMALIELYRVTGERKYLEFAGYLFSGVETQRLHLKPAQTTYMFSGIPFTSRTAFVGHAVRAMYASCGATDYYLETGDAKYKATLDVLWQDLSAHKLYITGGVGSRSDGEAFGDPYELPNAQAYTESCAAIANYMWNWRMLLASGGSRYADVIERALYNGINSGMSLDGTLYCYRNPLESLGEKIRNEFYDTDCCPPNIERTMAELPGYFYSTSSAGIYVNLYGDSTLDWHTASGNGVKLTQTTEYPWRNTIDLTVQPAKSETFSVFVRIPAWSKSTRLTVNGSAVAAAPGSYAEIRRHWNGGDRIHLELDMTPRLTEANTLVRENVGRVAVERGPLVYCLERGDQPLDVTLFDVSIALPGTPFDEMWKPGVLDGVLELRHAGAESSKPLESDPLYRDYATVRSAAKPVTLTFIPYYAWANRGQQEMEVWIPVANGALRAAN